MYVPKNVQQEEKGGSRHRGILYMSPSQFLLDRPQALSSYLPEFPTTTRDDSSSSKVTCPQLTSFRFDCAKSLIFTISHSLKSVNSDFTLAIRSLKFGQAKTHFLVSCWGKKRIRNMARPGIEPTISRSDIDCANHYSIGPLLENQQIYLYI